PNWSTWLEVASARRPVPVSSAWATPACRTNGWAVHIEGTPSAWPALCAAMVSTRKLFTMLRYVEDQDQLHARLTPGPSPKSHKCQPQRPAHDCGPFCETDVLSARATCPAPLEPVNVHP